MPAQRKIEIVNSLKKKLQKAKTVVLSDYSGCTHQQLEDLRQNIKKFAGEFHIVKNSLLKIVLSTNYKLPTTSYQLIGPTAVLITTNDDFSPIKIIHEKGQESGALKIKWGIWQGEIIGQDQVIRLATLPPREALLRQLVNQLAIPKSRLVYALKGNLQRLVWTLGKGVSKSVRREKSS